MAAESSTITECTELPLYVQDEVPQNPFDALLTRIAAPISTTYPNAYNILVASNGLEKSKSREPIDHYPFVKGDSIPDESTRVNQQIVMELFDSIRREDAESVALLIQHNLVTANTTSQRGQTPLLEAISTKNIDMVKEVLRLGADFNKFGVVVTQPDDLLRTPLMLAASIGSLPVVKLLFEPPYSADDTLVAPDGQIALRLAVKSNHSAIVNYLPSCRAGGYLRFKTHHARRTLRIKEALSHIRGVIEFFIWRLPKFFVWYVPKHVVVLPVVRSCKWCWANKKRIGLWCKHQLAEMPKRVARFGKAAWKTAKKVPKAVWKAAKKVPEAVWKAAKKTPEVIWKAIKKVLEAIREIGKALWRLLTVRIPDAILIALKWTWEGIISLAKAIGDIPVKIVSFLHTVLVAIITLLRNATLRDIWNGFCDILRAVFVTLPQTLWSWIQNLGSAFYRIMKALLGSFGEFLWSIGIILQIMFFSIPIRFGIILLNLVGSFAKALSEIIVWINPKA